MWKDCCRRPRKAKSISKKCRRLFYYFFLSYLYFAFKRASLLTGIWNDKKENKISVGWIDICGQTAGYEFVLLLQEPSKEVAWYISAIQLRAPPSTKRRGLTRLLKRRTLLRLSRRWWAESCEGDGRHFQLKSRWRLSVTRSSRSLSVNIG